MVAIISAWAYPIGESDLAVYPSPEKFKIVNDCLVQAFSQH